ncbi:MAG: hypothetical protein AB1757_13590 [Acidobacteriota bacterium]
MKKTAISISDTVFYQAEESARRLNMSRSEFYTKAILAYLQEHRDVDVTAKLNEVYAQNSSAIDKELSKVQNTILVEEHW